MSNVIDSFQQVFAGLNAGNIECVNDLYAENVTFIDPFHEIKGLNALRGYFSALYQNVLSCQFRFGEVYAKQNSAMLTWTMSLRHRTLSRNNPIEVPGSSQIHFDGKIYFHRDYFDAGQLVYENLPLIGPVVQYIKHKV
jgi:hypothetical protein